MLRALALCLLSACGDVAEPSASFGLRLVPDTSMRAVVGQRCVVLVESTLSSTRRSATLRAVVDAPFELLGRELPGGGSVSEIEVDPDGAVTDVRIEVAGEYGGERARVVGSIEVVEGSDALALEARRRLALFLAFLEDELGDEGITRRTHWVGAPVVSADDRYLFYSIRWEAGVAWWGERTWLYLRRRFAEARPSLAFFVRGAGAPPVPSAPPATVER